MFIKFCGFTRREDIEAVRDMPVSAIGFVFYRGSERYITPEHAGDLSEMLQSTGIMKTGVFVGYGADEIIEISNIAGLDCLQIYDPTLYTDLAGLMPIILCYRIKKTGDLNHIPLPRDGDMLLLDSYDPDVYGGSGAPFKWKLLEGYPHIDRTIIAGGLNESNVHQLLETIKPFGIDISSGIEISPGVKSIEKMKSLIKILEEERRNEKDAR
jgi:phosphoribosylanthranilate isomerase